MDCNPEIVVDKYLNLVYKICLTKLYNVDNSSVADACQEVFLNYLKKERRFENEQHEKAWFIRAAINCCTNIYKKSRYKVSNEESGDISEFNISVSGNFKTAEDDGLYEILALLPEKIRYAVYLFYIEEYSTEETAKILKTSGASIRMRLKRGREILREKFEQNNVFMKSNERSVADA